MAARVGSTEFVVNMNRTTRACSVLVGSEHALDSFGGRIFLRRTGVRFAGKCSSLPAERVARRLGNTPTICRKCYVHPEILTSYLDGALALELEKRAEAELRGSLADAGARWTDPAADGDPGGLTPE